MNPNGYFTKKCLTEAMLAFYRKDAGKLSIPKKAYEAGECAFKSVVLNESYRGNLAVSWEFYGEVDVFLIYDASGALLGNTYDFHQHYHLLKT